MKDWKSIWRLSGGYRGLMCLYTTMMYGDRTLSIGQELYDGRVFCQIRVIFYWLSWWFYKNCLIGQDDYCNNNFQKDNKLFCNRCYNIWWIIKHLFLQVNWTWCSQIPYNSPLCKWCHMCDKNMSLKQCLGIRSIVLINDVLYASAKYHKSKS